MHKPTERPIEVKRDTYSDALTPPNGPTPHTRVATRQAASTGQANLESGLSSDPQSGSTTQVTIISDDPTSPVIPRRNVLFMFLHWWFETPTHSKYDKAYCQNLTNSSAHTKCQTLRGVCLLPP